MYLIFITIYAYNIFYIYNNNLIFHLSYTYTVYIIIADEPTECGYELTMRSQYGCPKECPITKHGLCNSHGHCAYDTAVKG